MNYFFSSSAFFLSHLALAASFARSERSSGVMFDEDLRPPLDANAEIALGTGGFFTILNILTG